MRVQLGPAITTLILLLLISGWVVESAGQQAPVPDSTGTPLLRTGKSVYVVQRKERRGPDGDVRERWIETSIDLEYHNRTGHEVYFPTCTAIWPPFLMKKEDDRWVPAYAPGVRICRGPIVVVRPGERYRYQFTIHGTLPGFNSGPKFTTSVPGTYRVEWLHVFRTRVSNERNSPLRDRLPLAQRISNEFQLVEE